MKPRLAAIFLLIVLVPVAALGWLGYRVARDERDVVRQRVHDLLLTRLQDVDATMAGVLRLDERELRQAALSVPCDAESLRAMVRRHPLMQQVFVLDTDGRLALPLPGGDLSQAESDFLARTRGLWSDRRLFMPPTPVQQQAVANSAVETAPVQQSFDIVQRGQPLEGQMALNPTGEPLRRNGFGWYPWYWEHGLALLFWQWRPDGRVVAIETNRARLLADMIGALPATGSGPSEATAGRIVLVESSGDVIYQWGDGAASETSSPAAELHLSPPLAAWRLRYFLPHDELNGAFGGSILFNFLSGTAVVIVALLGLATYFYREQTRVAREAIQRVNFVNQVSHELKTPLTNIRMYAELLEDDLAEDDGRARRHLGVVAAESRRLSRLIGNVLTFARGQRRQLALRCQAGVIDAAVTAVLDSFRPALATRGIRIEFEAHAPALVRFDPDVVEQVLGNLISNVEKYAAAGGFLGIMTSQRDSQTTVAVRDLGPGIPAAEAEKVFWPFYRLSDRITDGVAGTGIGLTIVRDLARLHGGDVRLVASDKGACFEVTLQTPPTEGRGAS